MRNSLRDTDGYEDPDAYQIDEVPKTLQYVTTVPQSIQVITVERVLENCQDGEETKIETQQNTSQQSENKTAYRYAFGSRVKLDEEFDKGLGVVGIGSGASKQEPKPDTRQNTRQSTKPKTTKKRISGAPKPIKMTQKQDAVPPEEEEKKIGIPSAPLSVKKEYTSAEKDYINKKSKLDQQKKNLVTKEEDKLEIIRKRRKELFSSPFKHIGNLFIIFRTRG
jgi:small-conductance mechanosensitive channel